MEYKISEKDLELIFKGTKKRKRTRFKKFALYFVSLCLLYLSLFAIINYSGLIKNFGFWYKTEYKNDGNNNTAISSTIKTAKDASVAAFPEIADNHLRIFAIDIDAPIVWNVNNQPDEVSESLKNGVIHINGTALPGETGNVFITGHSSDLPWSRGNYKTVFALLSKLVIGDLVQIKYLNGNFIYKIKEIKTVSPDELSVMDSTENSILTLMTCTPVGTSLNRLIVISSQIFPDPKDNKPAGEAARQSKLPKTR